MSSFNFEKTRRKNFKCDGEWPLPSSIKTSFSLFSSNKALDVLHMDLFGLSRTASLAGNYYALVIVDDFSDIHGLCFFLLKLMHIKPLRNQLRFCIMEMKIE